MFFVSQFEISGKDFNDEQSKNNPVISTIFSMFHLEISGNDFNEDHP